MHALHGHTLRTHKCPPFNEQSRHSRLRDATDYNNLTIAAKHSDPNNIWITHSHTTPKAPPKSQPIRAIGAGAMNQKLATIHDFLPVFCGRCMSNEPKTGLKLLSSKIVGKRLRETLPAGRGKLRQTISVPIFNNLAPLISLVSNSQMAVQSQYGITFHILPPHDH